MANLDVRTPRFYCDYANFLMSRGITQNTNFDIITTDASHISAVNGTEAELFDMRPMNQVEFNTTGDRDGHVNVVFDMNTAGFNVNFVAILNHNMVDADAKVRISGDTNSTNSQSTSRINSVNHSGVDNEPTLVLADCLGVASVSGNIATPKTYSSTLNEGHMIITFDKINDRYFGVQFEGSDGVNFNASTNLKVGCIMLGEYYDMPHSPDLSIKRSVVFDGVTTHRSLGGQTYSNMIHSGRRSVSDENKTPFHTYFSSFGAYGGRMVYDMNFSYINSTDLMPPNYNEPQSSSDSVIEDIWNKTNGNHIPFIFSVDSTSMAQSDHMFARFANNTLETNQVADKVWNVKMKIQEEF